MEKEIEKFFSPAIRTRALQLFGMDTEVYEELDGFENFLYESKIGDIPGILRLSHSSKKTCLQVESELAYVNFLAQGQAHVAVPLLSRNDALIEIIPLEDGSYFSVVCFQKAPGGHPRGKDYTEHLFRVWGASLGKMHRLSLQYKPSRPELARIQWYEEVEVTQPERFLPPEQTLIVQRLEALKAELHALPLVEGQYGIIHNDLHSLNFLYDGDKITMIDFEDCVQMWFVSDLAISLFLMTVWPPEGCTREEYARKVFPPFLAGYRSEKDLPDEWLKTMPFFLKFREIGQYVAMYRGADLDDMDPWIERFMDGRRECIEQNVPWLAIEDWERIGNGV